MNEEEPLFNQTVPEIPPQIQDFVRAHVKPGIPINKQRKDIISEFCAQNGMGEAYARSLNDLVSKFDRVKKSSDIEHILAFGVWARNTVSPHFFLRGKCVYLTDQKTSLPDMLHSMGANFQYWTRVFGPEIFGTNQNKEHIEPAVWKAWLPLEGYYLSLKGGSGSGTFSIDIGIGFDDKHSDELRGQIWRVGVDIEIVSGKPVFRIIRTGSGQKSHGDDVRKKGLEDVRKVFLDEYTVSPQRLLLFLALEMAYVLKFNTVRGLSTQGAMDLSLLSRSKNPPDYTASMTGAGFTAREGNWHEMVDYQERYYDILAGNGYEDALQPHEVTGFDSALKTFNKLESPDGRTIPLQLAREEPYELEKAWDAYRKLHQQRGDRKRVRKTKRNDTE